MNELKNLIEQQFQKDNFLIQNSDSEYKEKYAVIYCSSNGVYREDTAECFTKSILETDNYEWFMTRIPYASKHIFIRDVSKCFYQYGINKNGLDSPEHIAEMLKKETEGYKVITIGSSSGGTMAVILGKLLNAEFTIAFSPVLKSFKDNDDKIKTRVRVNVLPYAQSDVTTFYIYPNGSDWDIYNSDLVKDYGNMYFLPIKSKIHGVPVNKRIIRKILSSNKEELKRICNYKTSDSISEFSLARIKWGFFFYIQRIFDYIKKYPLFFFRRDFYTDVLK